MIEVPVLIPGASYPVCIGHNALSDLNDLVAKHCEASTYVIISDTTVSRYYATVVSASLSDQAPCHRFEFPAGEPHKTRSTWGHLTDEMIAAGIGRDAAVIALGGGVVGDLAGFVAATYHRGIDYVQVPTSLLAMVDSSVGGKTGVDTDLGKNLVGSFHQPKLVVADTGTLDTLPDAHLRAGLAEAIKHGVIVDREYFDGLAANNEKIMSKDPDALITVVKRSVEIKAEVVGEDEKETGRRAILNFGHSVGHAIEALSEYKLLHGEAIAIGMVVESRLGEIMGITETGTTDHLREILHRFGLPTTMTSHSPEMLLAAIRRDKKNRAGVTRFSPITAIGQTTRTNTDSWTVELPGDLLRTALSQDSLS